MKILKFAIIRKTTYQNKKYKLFQVELTDKEDPTFLGTSIRRNLIKNTTDTKVTNARLFISNRDDNEKIYHFINEFTEIEEIEETIDEIVENMKNIQFKVPPEHFEKKVVSLNIEKNTKIVTAKDIILPKTLEIVNKDEKICTVRPDKINMKLLLTIEMRITILIHR